MQFIWSVWDNLFATDFLIEILSQYLKSLLLGAFLYFIVDF